MTDETPRQTVTEAINHLKHRDEYKLLLDFIKQLRDETIADIGGCKDPYDVMKLAGGTARLDELLTILQG